MLRRFVSGSLYVQVLTAIAAGVILGALWPKAGEAMKPLGDGFIKLIKMIIAPVIFCTIVQGIAGAGDMKKVGRTGGLALLYFEIVSTLALVIGLIVVNTVQPGAGMNVDASKLNAKSVEAYAGPGKMKSTTAFVLDIIPASFFDAFARGEILQVLLLALLTGFALQRLGEHGHTLFHWIGKCSEVLFQIVSMIMRLAPLGAFGAMAFTVGAYGVASLLSLAKLMGTFYATCIAFVVIVLGLIARLHGFSIWRFLKNIREELLIVLGTSSSEAALLPLMTRLEGLGAGRQTVGLVVPTGYSFNLDGTSIYLTLAAVFIAQATNTPLNFRDQLTLLAVLLITSKGAAGVTGSGFVVLAATLSAVGNVPVAGLALILGIDRFMSEARALTNLVGNAVATIVVAKWTGDLDEDRLKTALR
ncbi:MAG: dicarboxylate/amino acid:cation symporter [Acidobacteria bacterium]|nr:dicarboxylate/amino acid:cation symporter [Acidobacteriota bacterium]